MAGTDAIERATAGGSGAIEPARSDAREGVDAAAGEGASPESGEGAASGEGASGEGATPSDGEGHEAEHTTGPDREHAPAPEPEPAPEPAPASETPTEPLGSRIAEPLRDHLVAPIQHHVLEPIEDHFLEPLHDRLLDPIHGHLVEPFHGQVAEPIEGHLVEPLHERLVAPVTGAVGQVFAAAGGVWARRRGAVGRRLARRAREPLANLYDLYPEARAATPRELGLRFVPLEEIRGTAVAGAAQRGGDFLPLKPFRGDNWQGRWARIKAANERLQTLPPVDLVKYDGGFWVMDGHNRVAAALYAGGVGLDAVVTELVPLGASSSERPASFAPLMAESAAFRAAVQGHRPAFGVELGGMPVPDQALEREELERELDEPAATAAPDAPAPERGDPSGEPSRDSGAPGSAGRLDQPGASA